MGNIEIYSGFDASAAGVGYSSPVAGMVYMNIFDAAATLGRNLIEGQPQATVVGTPTVAAPTEGAQPRAQFLSRTNFVQTNTPQTEDITVWAVAFPEGEANTPLVSNYNGAGPLGCSLTFRDVVAANGLLEQQFTVNGAAVISGAQISSQSPPSMPQLLIGRFSRAENVRRLYNATLGLSAVTAVNTDPLVLAGDLRIGSTGPGGAGFDNTSFIYAAGIFHRGIIDEEMFTLAAYLTGYFGRRGLDIAPA
jgi:hypothetical protein